MSSSNKLLDGSCRLTVMEEKSINQVFADNLKALMEYKGLNQPALAEKIGVSQKTVSNCLNPGNRDASATGVERSANLTNVDRIAKALGTESWQMLRPLDSKQREFYIKMEDLYKVMHRDASDQPSSAVASLPLKQKSKLRGEGSKQKTPEKTRRSA